MSGISVVLATFNEEKNIKECLDSVGNFADEIVIVDGSSVDATVSLARKYTDKITITDNKPMFHVNKQMAIDAATKDWILQLDADERVMPELVEELKQVARKKTETSGFWIKRRNLFLGKWLRKGGAYPDPVIRFFKRGKGYLPCKSIHEQVEIKGEIDWLKHDLIHIADPKFSRYLLRSNRYTSLEAESIFKLNPGTNLFVILNYLLVKPKLRFINLYFRHQGFRDGFAGFVWAFYSALHIFTAYVKYWEAKRAGSDRYDTASDWAQ